MPRELVDLSEHIDFFQTPAKKTNVIMTIEEQEGEKPRKSTQKSKKSKKGSVSGKERSSTFKSHALRPTLIASLYY